MLVLFPAALIVQPLLKFRFTIPGTQISVAFFTIKLLSAFLFLIKPLSTPISAIPSRNVFNARGLDTLSLCGSSAYSTSSAMFVTEIIRLFRSNCPWEVGESRIEYFWK